MRCQACGMEYAGSHDCSAAVPLVIPEEMTTPPEGFCPGHYLQMALKIASFDDLAVRRASRDPDALAYGAVFSMVTASIIFLVSTLS